MQNPLAVTLLGLKNIDIVVGENRFICRYLDPQFLVSRAGINDNLRYSIATTERAVADMIHINAHYYFDNKIVIKKMDINKLQKEVGYDSTVAKGRTT